MRPRANWKGHLKLGLVTCPVALYTAASESDRIAFHTVNAKTGNRLQRRFVNSETGKPVDRDAQVKGYDTGNGHYVVLTDEDIEEAVPESTKVIDIEAFVTADDIDPVFLETPYYLAPTDTGGREAFAVIRRAIEEKNVIGIARTALFRRSRVLALRPSGVGLTATTLHFDYEIRPAEKSFEDIRKLDLAKEMVDLAKHIIKTKRAKFDPEDVKDRYEAALADLIRAKQQGKEIKAPPKPAHGGNVVNLLDALRKSAGGKTAAAKPRAQSGGRAKSRTPARSKAPPRRKAG